MSDVFVVSDEHHGHRGIIEFCNRPFVSTEEMTETIIARHNAKVPRRQSYVTIHVGDMFWHTLTTEECIRILDRMNGRHAFLYGNHDENILGSKELQAKFEWVRDTHMLYFNKKSLWLSHYAHRVWPRSHKGGWHVFGHSHQELPPMGKSFDIGVEGHDYEPWSLEEIAKKMESLPNHHVIPADKVWAKTDVS